MTNNNKKKHDKLSLVIFKCEPNLINNFFDRFEEKNICLLKEKPYFL